MGKRFLSLCACLLVLGGCTQAETSAPPSSASVFLQASEPAPEEEAAALTPEEIEKANEAFAPTVVEGNSIWASEISCFFTSEYADVRELDFVEFLRYCPVQTTLEDHEEEEYRDVMEAEGRTKYPAWVDFPTPVHRFKRDEISALLKKYAGITVDDLKDTGKAIYAEKYDCFYNFSSDFGPGTFQCEKGWKEGNKYRFVSEEYGKELVIEKVGEEYFIRSFTAIEGGQP